MGDFKPFLTGILVELMRTDSGADCLLTENFLEKESKGAIVEDFQTLKIASYNINRIKENFTKLELLLD